MNKEAEKKLAIILEKIMKQVHENTEMIDQLSDVVLALEQEILDIVEIQQKIIEK